MDELKSKMQNTDYYDTESEDQTSEEAGFLGTHQHPKSRNPRWWWLPYLRISLDLVPVTILILLSAMGAIQNPYAKDDKYGPTIARKNVILGNSAGFGPDVVYNNHEMLWNKTEMSRVHRNWQPLFGKGRGYVHVRPKDNFKVLHPPFVMVDVLEQGDRYEGYIIAMYHQLHCLSILTTSMGTSRTDWLAMDPKIVEHRSHCVEYLRQSIICNGDTTLEGETGAWATSTGWGQTHSCVNFDALTEWADGRAIWDLTGELLPLSFDPLKVVVGGDGGEGMVADGEREGRDF
ncbi:hypothetical protein Vi05172_g8789 [Venturia inaequalis]|nr:hypothetical protein Vi05172_g8789 [Venturia inaequalis]